VVCWEHAALVELAACLCDAAPLAWPERRFDLLWVFRRQVAHDEYGWEQLPQDLLAGDQR